LQLLQQVDDLGLNRYIEGGDGFVADQEQRVGGQRAGDADALALAAGELVGEAVDETAVQPDEGHEFLHALDALGLGVAQVVDAQRFADDAADRPARVERGERVLEDHLRLAADGLVVVAFGRLDVVAGDVAVAAGGRVEAQQRAPGGALAAAALAHQTQRLAAADLERQAIDGLHVAGHALEQQPLADGEVLCQFDDAHEGFVVGGGSVVVRHGSLVI